MDISKNNISIKMTNPRERNKKLKLKADKEQFSISNYVYNLIVKGFKK